jgi:hypothetical protein
MLLRKITKHITEQNWFAVFIDFLIVVVGVFIGIQVANWNETRQDRIKETQVLNALMVDFKLLDTASQHGVFFHKRALRGLGVVVEAVEQGFLAEQNKADFENGLRFGMYSASTNKSSGILNELLASGNLTLIQEPALRKTLAAYQSYIESVESGVQGTINLRTEFIHAFTSHFRYDLNNDHYRTDQESARAFKFTAIGAYDIAEMAADPAFIQDAEELYQMQRLWLQWEIKSLNRIRDIRLLLGDDSTPPLEDY